MTATVTAIEKFPRWREALAEFRKAGFGFGDIVKHQWFATALKLDQYGKGKLVRVDDFMKRQFAYAEALERIKHHLLREDQIYLQNEYSVGYRLVPPGEQTAVAMAKGVRDMCKAVEKMAEAVTCIRVDELTDAQRWENAEARAKVAQFSGMARAKLPRPFGD